MTPSKTDASAVLKGYKQVDADAFGAAGRREGLGRRAEATNGRHEDGDVAAVRGEGAGEVQQQQRREQGEEEDDEWEDEEVLYMMLNLGSVEPTLLVSCAGVRVIVCVFSLSSSLLPLCGIG